MGEQHKKAHEEKENGRAIFRISVDFARDSDETKQTSSFHQADERCLKHIWFLPKPETHNRSTGSNE